MRYTTPFYAVEDVEVKDVITLSIGLSDKNYTEEAGVTEDGAPSNSAVSDVTNLL